MRYEEVYSTLSDIHNELFFVFSINIPFTSWLKSNREKTREEILVFMEWNFYALLKGEM